MTPIARSLPFLMLLAFAGAPVALRAQTLAAKFVDSARVELDRAMESRDTARIARTVVMLDRALVVYPNDAYLLHYRGYAAYRQAVLCFMSNNMSCAAPYVQRGITDLDKSGEKLPWPETFALLASLSGFAIGIDQNRGMELGPQIGMLQARAMQLGPKNPRVWLVQGEGAANTPPEYGGGVDKAREMIKKAIELFAADAPAPLAPAWGKEEAAAYLKMLDGGAAKRP
jgi:hypothetical protein